MDREITLKCISCKSYELRMPEHGNGDLPYYICKENEKPDKCKKWEDKNEKH